MERTLYNQNIKIRFLNEIRDGTKNFYEYVLSKAEKTEIILKKDVFEFNTTELDSLIKSYKNKSIQTVQSTVAVLKKYIDWAIKEGFVFSGINFLQPLECKDLYKYVNLIARDMRYVTREELLDIVDSCNNRQDSVPFALLFEGAKGENLEELRNLKVSDCNFKTNELILTKDSGEKRSLIVSNRTMELINDAISEKEYYKNNGAETTAKSTMFPITETEYVLRISGRNEVSTIKPASINARICRIGKWNGNDFITSTTIWFSGMIDMAKEIKNKNGKLVKNDYLEINRRFGYDEGYWFQTKVRVNDGLKLVE